MPREGQSNVIRRTGPIEEIPYSTPLERFIGLVNWFEYVEMKPEWDRIESERLQKRRDKKRSKRHELAGIDQGNR